MLYKSMKSPSWRAAESTEECSSCPTSTFYQKLMQFLKPYRFVVPSHKNVKWCITSQKAKEIFSDNRNPQMFGRDLWIPCGILLDSWDFKSFVLKDTLKQMCFEFRINCAFHSKVPYKVRPCKISQFHSYSYCDIYHIVSREASNNPHSHGVKRGCL